jgi:hypothetical protein
MSLTRTKSRHRYFILYESDYPVLAAYLSVTLGRKPIEDQISNNSFQIIWDIPQMFDCHTYCVFHVVFGQAIKLIKIRIIRSDADLSLLTIKFTAAVSVER